MLHYFFGPPERQLFGVYHPPNITRDKSRCVLICNAFGHEYLRSYWAMRQIAIRLSEGGYHVLRFDYSCTGDSAGSIKDSDAEQWIEDVEIAISELMDISGTDKIDIVSLRLGSWLALQAAKNIKQIFKIVLWDPVMSGHEYILYLLEIYKTMCIKAKCFIEGDSTKATQFPEDVLGLCTTNHMVDFINRIDNLGLLSSLQNETYIVLTKSESKLSAQFQGLLDMDYRKFKIKVCEDLIDWRSYHELGDTIFPYASIQYICRDIF